MTAKRKLTVRETEDGFVLEEYTRYLGEPRGRKDKVFVTLKELRTLAKKLKRPYAGGILAEG